MKRAPIVVTGTLVGLAGVLSFRSTPAAISIGGLSSGPTATTTAPATATTSSPDPATTAGASPPTTSQSPSTTVAPTPTAHVTVTTRPPTTTAATTVRSATGPSVNYFFGTLSVKVAASDSKITAVSIASLSDGGNPRSQTIDQQAIPLLIQQVMAAQSSKIQGVSGATYTSEGFYTSLLAALKQLGIA
jgi:uncharacterized protein with FMN-binding domain